MRANGQYQEKQQQHETNLQLQQTGQRMQQQELQDLLHNPKVMELLLEPDINADEWLEDTLSDHVNIDQVLSIFNEEDLYKLSWKNKLWTTKTQWSYPPPESQSGDDIVNEIQESIHGFDKRPLSPDERREIEAGFEHKTTREKRAKFGEFVDLLLSQVVKAESKQSDSGSSRNLLPIGGK